MTYHLPPVNVVETIKRFQKPFETRELFNYPAKDGDTLYFYAVFKRWKKVVGTILVREDGEAPPKTQIRDILWMVASTNYTAHFFLKEGWRWAQAPEWVLKELIDLLEKVERAYRREMPPDVQEALDVFKSVPRIHLETQAEIRQAVHEAIQYYRSMRYFTKEAAHKIEEYLRRVLWNKFQQHESQIQTYAARKKVLAYLKSRVSIFRPRMWWLYRRLVVHHQGLTASRKEREIQEEIRTDIYGEKGRPEAFEKEALPINRNPS